MKVNYVLMYGTPYLKYREFETFEDVSKFLVNKSIVNYSIFKKLEDKEEVEMIYRDNDIRYLEDKINKAIDYIEEKYDYILGDDTFLDHDERIDRKQIKHILEILDKENN